MHYGLLALISLTVVTAYFSFCPMRDRPPRPGATLS